MDDFPVLHGDFSADHGVLDTLRRFPRFLIGGPVPDPERSKTVISASDPSFRLPFPVSPIRSAGSHVIFSTASSSDNSFFSITYSRISLGNVPLPLGCPCPLLYSPVADHNGGRMDDTLVDFRCIQKIATTSAPGSFSLRA